MTATKRDPRTLPPAFTDESWLRGAALIDGAFAAADALAAEIAARTTTPGEAGPGLSSRTAGPSRIAPAGNTPPIQRLPAGATPNEAAQ